MSDRCAIYVAVVLLAALACIPTVVASEAGAWRITGRPSAPTKPVPAFMPRGQLSFPTTYREWIFLSTGFDVNDRERGGAAREPAFDNVFVNPGAYREFVQTGTWPDGTKFVREARSAAEKDAIDHRGQVVAGEPSGVEVRVKDTKRFSIGLAFVEFDGLKPAQALPANAAFCDCHGRHAAVDTTFVQFYPTFICLATVRRTLSPGYHP